ncbi:MAG: pantoate--beta-alanine ligase [bacterium]
MKVIKTVKEMQEFSIEQRLKGRRIVLVPTMGYLHDGHLSLLKEGKKHGDVLVMSLFVNPTQFGPKEDFSRYPRDFDRDSKLAGFAGTDIIFYPSVDEMYPEHFKTSVYVSELSEVLCGETRPGHFKGVTTVVSKLFNIVLPHVAIFGEKDFQQLVIIKQMVKDLNIPVVIIGMPTVREADGLAMSSRNTYLSGQARQRAISIYKGLKNALDAFRNGINESRRLRDIVLQEIQSAGLREDYVEVIDEETLTPVPEASSKTRIVVAAYVDNVRLIDNIALK